MSSFSSFLPFQAASRLSSSAIRHPGRLWGLLKVVNIHVVVCRHLYTWAYNYIVTIILFFLLNQPFHSEKIPCFAETVGKFHHQQ